MILVNWKKKFWEFDFLFTNRKTRVEAEYNNCLSRIHAQCVMEANNKERQRLPANDPRLGESARTLQNAVTLRDQNIQFEADQFAETAKIEDTFYACLAADTAATVANPSRVVSVWANQGLDIVAYMCEQGSEAYVKLMEKVASYKKAYGFEGLTFEEMMRGKFLNVGAFAQAVGGIHGELEMIAAGKGVKNCFGLFCVTGVSTAMKVGAGVGASTGQALNCEDNNAYKGAFLSIGAEIQGLAGVGVSYSFGISPHNFISTLQSMSTDPNGYQNSLVKTQEELTKLLRDPRTEFRLQMNALFMIYILDKLVPNSVTDSNPALQNARTMAKSLVEEKMKDPQFKKKIIEEMKSFLPGGNASVPSMGNVIKGSLGMMNEVVQDPGAKAMIAAMNAGLTGCDSVSVGASLGITAAAGGSVKLTDYNLLGEIPYEDMKYAAELFSSSDELVRAKACSDPTGFLMRMGNIFGRLGEMYNNIGSCYGASNKDLLSYEERVRTALLGNPYDESAWENTYDRDYKISHPYHASHCKCGKHEGDTCKDCMEGENCPQPGNVPTPAPDTLTHEFEPIEVK